MVQIKAFSYNPNAKYQQSEVYKTKDPDIIKQTIEVKQPSDSGSSFTAKFPDVFDKKVLPYVESDALVRAWNYTPMRFWQNQLNFAVWCATTGCGVSYEDHLSGDIPGFAKSMFMFHVYYQIRRIIFELKAPLPTDQSWNAFDNSMDAKAYEKICAEFNVDKNTDWRQKLDDNGGLGIIFNYITSTGYQPLKGFSYDAHQMSFTEYNKGKLHIDYISLSIGMPGQHSYLISQHDQALSVSMNQSAHVAGQSLVLNLRLNQISSGLGAHLMRRNNFLLILKMQSRAL